MGVATYVKRGEQGNSTPAVLAFVDGAKLPIRTVEDRGSPPVALRTNAMPITLEAERLGWGAGDLPCFVADAATGLQRAFPEEPAQLLDIWLVVHAQSQRTPRIRAVLDELARAFRKHRALLAGTPYPPASPG